MFCYNLIKFSLTKKFFDLKFVWYFRVLTNDSDKISSKKAKLNPKLITMKIELKLDDKNGVFLLIDENEKEVGELTFMLKDEQMLINHTGVNPELRGQGLAEKLVLEAVKYARENQLKIRPFCSYVSVYIGKHPEVQDVI